MVIRNRTTADAARARARAAARAAAEPRYWTRLQRAARTFGLRVPRMRKDLQCLVAAHTDRVRASIRQLAIKAALGVLAGIVGIAVLATAAVLLVRGIAGGLAAAFGIAWLGDLLAGAIVLGGIALATAIALGSARKKRMRSLVERYARYDPPPVGPPAPPGDREPVARIPRPEPVRS